jgi:hypothetical protein
MNIKNAKLPSASLPPVNKNNEYAYRYRITSEDKNRISAWSPIKIIAAPTVQFFGEDTENISISGNSITATWDDENNRPRYDVFTRFYFMVNKASLTSNVATLHTTVNHNIVVGDKIVVTGVGAVFDTDNENPYHVITEVTADTVRFDKVSTNISQFNVSPNGTAGLDYSYHGTTPIHTYSFLKKTGSGSRLALAIQVEGITVDGTKPFYGTVDGADVDAGENALLVYRTPSNGIIL